ncbi:MAG: hypothetical protein M3Q27_06665 [Actinomycetota bacterium]|nr:hypothetical protein [Actinomycetota bacterium]
MTVPAATRPIPSSLLGEVLGFAEPIEPADARVLAAARTVAGRLEGARSGAGAAWRRAVVLPAEGVELLITSVDAVAGPTPQPRLAHALTCLAAVGCSQRSRVAAQRHLERSRLTRAAAALRAARDAAAKAAGQ